MDNPSRSVCLIENAIDRLIEYGDRIHAAYNRHGATEVSRRKPQSRVGGSGYATTQSRSLDISVSKCGRHSQSGSVSGPDRRSRSSGIGRGRSCSCSRSRPCYCSSQSSHLAEDMKVASPTASESIVSEKETTNNFLYTVMKGNRRCTIPGKMCSKRLPDSWIRVDFMLYDEDGGQLLDLRTEILGEALRNTIVNGKPVQFM
ncbi:hypothetical protein GCK32_002451 [Trichostrongylus colubriformis]|uniref:Uncharacterized protein n=1 Tax=Trichostrongylus colubriformis TaxID=6319 RepID=A0AAN8FVN6_TRICO